MSKENKLLIIIDDVLPLDLSSFRNIELCEYAKKFENIVVLNTSQREINEDNILDIFVKTKIRFFQSNLNDKNFELFLEYINEFDNKVAMITFLNNVFALDGKVLKFLEKYNIKFSFTLYPGGGFFMDNESNKKLKNIFSSPVFYKVIVTQKQTYNYLISNNLCSKKNIKMIYGLVTSPKFLKLKISKSKCYNSNKNNIDICFAAYKYCEKGIDKGYDIFIDVAKELCKRHENLMFHVAGNFDENDIDIQPIQNNLKFHGILNDDDFIKFFYDMDIMLSPTRANILHQGAFDGFPTGASSDAILSGVVLITTDPLENNVYFKNNKDLIIVESNTDEIIDKIESLIVDKKLMKKISFNGYIKANHLYSIKKQMVLRNKIIERMWYLS